VKQTPGGIGYIELAYAMQNKMAAATIKNKAGNFIYPSLASITDAQDGYPISSFTWAIIYKEQNYNNRSQNRAQQLLKLLWWNIHDGQQYCKPLTYAPLSQSAIKVGESILTSATFSGKPILP
jgi:phosphate transport system substrate-binding protein